jgi:hypothetical protein
MIGGITSEIRNNWSEVYFSAIKFGREWRVIYVDRINWCIDNLDNNTWIYQTIPSGRAFFFKSIDDAILFKLIWWDI